MLTINLENTLPQLFSANIVPLTAPPSRRHPSWLTSPYRAPLLRFLNRHAKEAVTYFLKPSRLCMGDYSSRLLDAVAGDDAAAMVQELHTRVASFEALLRLEDVWFHVFQE